MLLRWSFANMVTNSSEQGAKAGDENDQAGGSKGGTRLGDGGNGDPGEGVTVMGREMIAMGPKGISVGIWYSS